jgi:hypothetical protein
MMVDLIKFVFLVFKSVFEAHFQCAKHPLSFSLELDSLSAPAPPKTESHGRVKPEVGNIALVALASSDDCCAGWISWMAQGMGAWHATVRALACPHVRGAADDVITTHCVRLTAFVYYLTWATGRPSARVTGKRLFPFRGLI